MSAVNGLGLSMPKFENTWNWTNVISLVGIAIGGVVAFVNVQSRTDHLEQEVQAVRIQVEKVETIPAKRYIFTLTLPPPS